MGVLVSVAIPAFNRTDWLVKCVCSLASQTLPAEQFAVFVVDASPNDNNERAMLELAAEMPFSLRCIRKKPEGPGPSRNMGARQNDSPYIAFLDSDCYVTPDWLEAGLHAFAASPCIGIVQGRVLPDPDVPTGIFSHYIRIEAESFFYETANIFYRRETFEQCGGFPADLLPNAELPMGGEDTQAAWTAKRLGWETTFAPGSLVYHEVRQRGLKEWICIRNLFVVPSLIGKFPELRRFMYRGYFYDRAQGYLSLALFGVSLALWQPFSALLVLPYVVHRAMGQSKTLTGPLRLARVGAYFLRDITSMCLLILGSVRYRALLL
jgi:GT2 family glycosyltransferase